MIILAEHIESRFKKKDWDLQNIEFSALFSPFHVIA